MKEQLEHCPVCGSSHIEKHIDTVDFSTSKEPFSVYKCLNCSHLYTNPRVVESKIGPYYDNPDYISHTNDNASLFGQVYQRLRDINLKRKLSYVNKVFQNSGDVLDYGCGTGQFLNTLVNDDKSVLGVEINEGAREQAQKYAPVFSSISEVQTRLEVITMWHVLEHVYDLRGLLGEFKKRLIPGGHLIVAVPNPESFDAQHYGMHWAAWDVPIHIHHFTQRSVKTLMESEGFSLVDVIPMNMDSYYISLLSEQYKSGSRKKMLKHWINALWYGFKSNTRAGKTNTSSKIYVLKYS